MKKRTAEPSASDGASTLLAQAALARQEDAIQDIRLKTLRLCHAIVSVAPKGRRLDSALSSIRTGVRLALEEIQPGAEAAPLGRAGGPRTGSKGQGND